jgi:hypothetical protein
VTNADFPECDVLVLFEGIFFMSGRGVISGVTNFLHEESLHWKTGADVDEQGEVELLFSMSSFSPLTESWIEKSVLWKMRGLHGEIPHFWKPLTAFYVVATRR